MMTLTLHFFGPLNDLFGGGQRDYTFDDGKTPAEVLDTLISQTGLEEVRKIPLRFAVNDEFAPGTVTLHHGDRLSLLPPVSGG